VLSSCVRFSFSHAKPRDWLGKRLRNDLFCVEWDVKPQLGQAVTVCVCVCVCFRDGVYSRGELRIPTDVRLRTIVSTVCQLSREFIEFLGRDFHTTSLSSKWKNTIVEIVMNNDN